MSLHISRVHGRWRDGHDTGTDVVRGLLIYPAHEVPIRDEVRIRNTSVRVRQTTIDLGGSGKLLRRVCDDLAGEVFTWSEPQD